MDQDGDADMSIAYRIGILIVLLCVLGVGIFLGWALGTPSKKDPDQRYICGYNAPKVEVRCDYPLEPPIDSWEESK